MKQTPAQRRSVAPVSVFESGKLRTKSAQAVATRSRMISPYTFKGALPDGTGEPFGPPVRGPSTLGSPLLVVGTVVAVLVLVEVREVTAQEFRHVVVERPRFDVCVDTVVLPPVVDVRDEAKLELLEALQHEAVIGGELLAEPRSLRCEEVVRLRVVRELAAEEDEHVRREADDGENREQDERRLVVGDDLL